MLGVVVERARSCCLPSPQLGGGRGGTGGDGGGVEKMRHFHQLLRYCPKSFDQSCSNIGFYKCMTCIRNTTYIITQYLVPFVGVYAH